jgi:hypothetical protein
MIEKKQPKKPKKQYAAFPKHLATFLQHEEINTTMRS